MPSGRFTQAGPLLPFLLGVAITLLFYAALIPLKDQWLATSFRDRGWVPYVIVLLTSWTLMILLVKNHKIRIQRQALALRVVPDEADFVLTPSEAGGVLDKLHELADDPKRFMLFNRIHVALSNLRNMGRIGDVDEVLRSQSENDESMMESSYTVARGFIWAIPVLGFIGTVLGLSVAIGSFGEVLSESKEVESLKPALQNVTSGLATAFETTLQALVAAVFIHMLLTMTRRKEEQMLDEFNEYCQRNIVSRLRLSAADDSGRLLT